MDTQAVNWGALDALVLDYLDQERLLVEDSDDNPLIGPHPHNVRETISLIRALIEAGYIPESLHLLHQHAPMVLEDQRLLFRLYKQVCPILHPHVEIGLGHGVPLLSRIVEFPWLTVSAIGLKSVLLDVHCCSQLLNFLGLGFQRVGFVNCL